MKLLIAIVDGRDARVIREQLIEAGFDFTEIGSTGGFLRHGTVTLLIGVESERVEEAIELLRHYGHAREEMVSVHAPDTRLFGSVTGEAQVVTLGGAKVFVVDVERALSL